MTDVSAYHRELARSMVERDLTQAVADLAKTYGLLRYHTYRSDRSPAGFPDEVIVGQTVLWRELKQQGKYPSPAQREWLEKLKAAGEDADVWKPMDLFSGRIRAELAACAGRR